MNRIHGLSTRDAERLHREFGPNEIVRSRLESRLAELKKILGEESELLRVIGQEFREIRDAYGDARRSEIQRETKDLRLEDLIVDEEMVVTISHGGYIKRSPLTVYRAQRRGGGTVAAAVLTGLTLSLLMRLRLAWPSMDLPFIAGGRMTPEQYLALLARDRRCRFPGCRIPGKYTVVHHLVRFPLGPTDIHNMCLLCDLHHHLVHDGNWRMESTPTGRIAVYRPDGTLFETLDTT